MPLRSQLTRIGAPAFWALKAHWVTAALLVITGTVALAALLPVSALFHRGPLPLGPRLIAPAVRTPDFQLPLSSLATTPGVFRSAATASLFSVLALIAGGVFLVAAITLLAVADARSAARANEISVRRAVGASRSVLLLAAGCESAVVASAILVAGGLAGLVGARAAGAAWPGQLVAGTLWVTLAVSGALLLLTCFGVSLPATRERRRTPLGGRKGRALELVLPALQLGVSLTVLGSAALLIRHAAVLKRGAGVPAGDGIVFAVTAPDRPAAERGRAYATLLDGLRSQGMSGVSLTSAGAELGLGTGDGILTDCGRCAWGGIAVPWRLPFVTHFLVSADTFRLLNLHMLDGRELTDRDTFDAPRVAVVSASLAAENFEGGHAVGRRLQIGHGLFDWYTVVGVVADQLPAGYGGGLEPPDALYLSVLQHPAQVVDLLVRAPPDPQVVAGVRGTLRATLGPEVAVTQEREAAYVTAEAAPVRWFGRLYGVEGWIILGIATLGTFVVMWLWVASLSHDLAVRRAVGARRRDILRFILVRAIGVGLAGVAFGLWCGMSIWGALTSIIAGLPPWEPMPLLRYALLLVLAALAGALLPAWRAARTAPAILIGHADG
ncbi:MAG TPA: FtsX-like permease family protein [Gemmatimonadales bacterium]|nr:FtsX-like permease family protein [Gemmatimonadales bacterium]